MRRKHSADNIRKINIYKVRGWLGLQGKSASDLARHLKISPQHLSDLLNGNRNHVPYLPRIAKYLGVKADEILVSDSATPRYTIVEL